MNDVVERVARAIEHHFSAADRAYGEHVDCARAAIIETLKSLREPTEAVWDAGAQAELNMIDDVGHAPALRVWQRMIDAALADASPDIGKEGIGND